MKSLYKLPAIGIIILIYSTCRKDIPVTYNCKLFGTNYGFILYDEQGRITSTGSDSFDYSNEFVRYYPYKDYPEAFYYDFYYSADSLVTLEIKSFFNTYDGIPIFDTIHFYYDSGVLIYSQRGNSETRFYYDVNGDPKVDSVFNNSDDCTSLTKYKWYDTIDVYNVQYVYNVQQQFQGSTLEYTPIRKFIKLLKYATIETPPVGGCEQDEYNYTYILDEYDKIIESNKYHDYQASCWLLHDNSTTFYLWECEPE